MVLLETKRLIIKQTSLETLDDIHTLYSDPDVIRYLDRDLKTREKTQAFIENMIRHQEKHSFSSGNVYEKETSAFIGRRGLIYLDMDDSQPEIEVGYILHKQFWNKGYATELANAFLEWAFIHLPVEKLVASVLHENKASCHVLEKIGMHCVGDMLYSGNVVAKYEVLKYQTTT